MRRSSHWFLGGAAGAATGLSLAFGGAIHAWRQPPAVPEPSIVRWDLAESDPTRAVLRKRISVQFKNTTLRKAMEDIRRQIEANVVLDAQGLQNANIDADELHLDLQLKDVRASTVLALMLEPHGLTWAAEDRVVTITDKESQKKKNVSILHPIADLAVRPYGREVEDVGRKILGLVVNTVDRDVWEANGGDATILYQSYNASLVIYAPEETHEKVELPPTGLRELQRRLPDLLRRSHLPEPRAFFDRRRVVVQSGGETTPPPKDGENADAKTTAAEAKKIADTALLLALRLEAEKSGAAAAPKDQKQ